MPRKSILSGLGEEVRERRKKRKLTIEALAFQAGVHANVVARLERGIYNPTILTLQSIAVELDVSLHELLAGAARRV